MNDFCVYILTNWSNRIMYVGSTGDLKRRLRQHRSYGEEHFTGRYHCHKLVYFERQPDETAARAREFQIKKWNREKKNALVETLNPRWMELDPRWPV